MSFYSCLKLSTDLIKLCLLLYCVTDSEKATISTHLGYRFTQNLQIYKKKSGSIAAITLSLSCRSLGLLVVDIIPISEGPAWCRTPVPHRMPPLPHFFNSISLHFPLWCRCLDPFCVTWVLSEFITEKKMTNIRKIKPFGKEKKHCKNKGLISYDHVDCRGIVASMNC